MKLDGSAAVVTGGGSGLGRASAEALAAAGAKVTIFDRDTVAGEACAKAIGGAFFKADVTSEEEISAAFAGARERHGQERILVCCAGTGRSMRAVSRGSNGEIRSYPMDLFSTIIDVNLTGTFRCITQSAMGMLTNDPDEGGERGLIVTTSSIAAQDGQMGTCAYAASKGALCAMTLVLARDLAREGVRVNSILPGVFATPPIVQAAGPANALEADIPFPPRMGDPAEFASMVLEMCRNSYINATNIRLDAGLRMAMPPRK